MSTGEQREQDRLLGRGSGISFQKSIKFSADGFKSYSITQEGYYERDPELDPEQEEKKK